MGVVRVRVDFGAALDCWMAGCVVRGEGLRN